MAHCMTDYARAYVLSALQWLWVLAGAYVVLWRCRGTSDLLDHDQSLSGLREMKTLVTDTATRRRAIDHSLPSAFSFL